jgi:hypothetical protein
MRQILQQRINSEELVMCAFFSIIIHIIKVFQKYCFVDVTIYRQENFFLQKQTSKGTDHNYDYI